MLFAVVGAVAQANDHDRLWQAFLSPPDSIRVGCYYYWVNEHVDPEGVRADLQWMKQNGITLAFLATDIRNRTRWERPWEGETFGKNKFQSPLWWENLRTALRTASELGIEMGLFNCPGWSQSGGPWVKPDEAMRNWTPAGIEICQTKQGTDVACGPCSPEAEGLEVDKLSKTHVKKHFESFIGEILRRIPPEDRRTLTTVVVDSWERGKQNYTDSIYEKFRQRYGYELDYATVVNPQSSIFNPQSSKDLDRLIANLVASEYMGGLTEKAHEYGLRTWCEPYAHSPFPGNSITYGSAADEVAAEFWVNDKKFRQKEVDAALGAARRSGKNRVWAESFTDGGWTGVAKDDWSFEKLKPLADRYFHAGINATILHVMISQPGDPSEPAVRPWFGTFFDRRSAHAADLKPLVDYLRRCNFMLQLGKPYQDATDQRILPDGTIIRFTDASLFEITFPDGRKETWNPVRSASAQKKAVSILGDSYSTYEGYLTPSTNAIWYHVKNAEKKTDVTSVRQTWWHQLISQQGWKLCVNNSYSGATICNTGYDGNDYSDRSFLTRMDNLGCPDIIFIFGATNDSWAHSPIGEFKYDDITGGDLWTFRPALARLLSHMQDRYIGTDLYFILNDGLTGDITSSVKTICEHYGVKCIVLHDIHKLSGHPSVQGMKQIAEQITEQLDQ